MASPSLASSGSDGTHVLLAATQESNTTTSSHITDNKGLPLRVFVPCIAVAGSVLCLVFVIALVLILKRRRHGERNRHFRTARSNTQMSFDNMAYVICRPRTPEVTSRQDAHGISGITNTVKRKLSAFSLLGLQTQDIPAEFSCGRLEIVETMPYSTVLPEELGEIVLTAQV
ncbi:uncharacterized protein LOC116604463 [Nematostella vectensis]|uniref:uncharacterized protein LOC116604463 n=1 Tax=Nematostella vectensis TaxID=45351 RepID=UPI0020773B26|nr:uncharacterized protein LOC116604463 [Nematostella vectensis]